MIISKPRWLWSTIAAAVSTLSISASAFDNPYDNSGQTLQYGYGQAPQYGESSQGRSRSPAVRNGFSSQRRDDGYGPQPAYGYGQQQYSYAAPQRGYGGGQFDFPQQSYGGTQSGFPDGSSYASPNGGTNQGEGTRAEPTHRRRHHRREYDFGDNNGGIRVHIRSRQAVDGDTPDGAVAATGQMVACVRTCDGYFFPLGQASDTNALAAQASLCTALCPNAQTELFLIPPGADGIEAAGSLTGRPYSKMPNALHYTKGVSEACTCRKPTDNQARLVALMKDFTLRRGDAVMTDRGVMVFKGAWRWPYKTADFLLLDKAKAFLSNAIALAAFDTQSKWLQFRLPRLKSPSAKVEAQIATYIIDGAGRKVRLVGEAQTYATAAADVQPVRSTARSTPSGGTPASPAVTGDAAVVKIPVVAGNPVEPKAR